MCAAVYAKFPLARTVYKLHPTGNPRSLVAAFGITTETAAGSATIVASNQRQITL
jgi:hypothetical protein